MSSRLPCFMKRQVHDAYDSMSAALARYFVAGATVDDALVVCRRFEQQGWGITICPWDSAGEEPEIVFESYIEALRRCCIERAGSRLAIKLPSLRYDIGMVRELLERTKGTGVVVHFDALAPDTVNRTFAVIRSLRPSFENMGCTLPARWQRSLRDAEEVLELGLPVRLVKGQWADADGHDREPRRGFLRLVDKLLRCVNLIGLATHDAPLLKLVFARLPQSGPPVEVEQLFRLPLVPKESCGARPRRIYIPYGHAYLPYALSRLVEKPKLALWLLSDAVEQRFTAG